MKLTLLWITLIALFTFNFAEATSNKIVYGKDNRVDYYQSTRHRNLVQATAGMINLRLFNKAAHNTFSLPQVTTLGRSQNLCSQEAYVNQPVAANCTGFLVGQDTLVTAGHCFLSQGNAEAQCKQNAWVFDFNMKSAYHDPTRSIHISNVYLCKSIVKAELNSVNDYAIIKLDRPVIGRTPLKFREAGKVGLGAPLLVIGHPSGLPTKIAQGGRVTYNSDPTTFSGTVDTFAGNSGSPVFDARTGLVEGILIQGRTDYIFSIPGNKESCRVVHRCSDNITNCTGGIIPSDERYLKYGEKVFRITAISQAIKSAIK